MTFTAQELERAIEDGADDEWEGWGELAYAYEPNPDFDPEKSAEADRLYEVWRTKRSNSWQPDDPDYRAYVDYREANKGSLDRQRQCDPKVTVNGVTYALKVVEDHGGGEGSGSERFIVFEVDGRLFRKDGYYQSYVGSEWDGELREVRAVQKSVTFYE